ncbi:MAG: hypothetical protein V4561_01435 [Bacteroidota bacterium]
MELNKMGLQEMSLQETQETEGGIWALLIAAAEIIYDVATSPNDVKKGINDGINFWGGKKP